MASVTSSDRIPNPATKAIVREGKSIPWLALLGTFAFLCGVYALAVRPWLKSWGATPYEQHRSFPGDLYGPQPNRETRAITINAPSSLVWRWVAQLGQDRGGFYSYDILENLVGGQMPADDYLRPDRQTWHPGDKLWMYPPSKGVAISAAPLVTYVPGRALAFATTLDNPNDSRWNFLLEPIDGSHTRLIVRGEGPVANSPFRRIFDLAIFEPAHFAMEKRTMIGIKQLSEGHSRARILNNVMVSLWTITFGLWIAAMVFVLRRRAWKRSLLGFLAAGVVFQVLTLGQPPVLIGCLLVATLAWLLWPVKSIQRDPLAHTVK